MQMADVNSVFILTEKAEEDRYILVSGIQRRRVILYTHSCFLLSLLLVSLVVVLGLTLPSNELRSLSTLPLPLHSFSDDRIMLEILNTQERERVSRLSTLHRDILYPSDPLHELSFSLPIYSLQPTRARTSLSTGKIQESPRRS